MNRRAKLLVGPPDEGSSNGPLAWQPQIAFGTLEWAELEYRSRRLATGVQVHKNYLPFSVSKVLAYDTWGSESVVWTPADSPAEKILKSGWRITFNRPIKTRRIKLIFDSQPVNEIDAVGLEDNVNEVQWASKATTSCPLGYGAPWRQNMELIK